MAERFGRPSWPILASISSATGLGILTVKMMVSPRQFAALFVNRLIPHDIRRGREWGRGTQAPSAGTVHRCVRRGAPGRRCAHSAGMSCGPPSVPRGTSYTSTPRLARIPAERLKPCWGGGRRDRFLGGEPRIGRLGRWYTAAAGSA